MSDGAPSATLQVDVYLTPEDRLDALREDARQGLTATPKELPPKWFYDERGSMLFEEITKLPEYYLTGRERIILAEHAHDVARLTAANTLVEPGSGSSEKTRLLLDAMVEAGYLKRFVPFDVSEQALREAAARIADEYPGIEVHGVVGDFEHHLVWLPEGRRRLFAFLGSSSATSRAHSARRSWPICTGCSGRARRCCSAPTSSRTPHGSRRRTTTHVA